MLDQLSSGNKKLDQTLRNCLYRVKSGPADHASKADVWQSCKMAKGQADAAMEAGPSRRPR
jgi:hypothetical protein